jgi:hypothetical protein
MAKLKVKDFVDAYDIKESTVKSYLHRKKLHKDADGFIDTENPINKLLISELKLKIETNKVGKSNDEKTITVKKSNTVNTNGLTESQKQYADIDYRTRVATAETKEREAELKRIQLEKMAGNLLPVELVQSILVINIQNLIKNFEGELENMASIYITDRELLSIATTKQKELLAKIVLKSKEDAMFEIENSINEYQEVRGRGERK